MDFPPMHKINKKKTEIVSLARSKGHKLGTQHQPKPTPTIGPRNVALVFCRWPWAFQIGESCFSMSLVYMQMDVYSYLKNKYTKVEDAGWVMEWKQYIGVTPSTRSTFQLVMHLHFNHCFVGCRIYSFRPQK